MSFAIPYPMVNGHRYSYASIEIRILDKVITGFSAVNYNHALTPADVYGTGSHKIGRTRGKEEPAADMEMYKLEFANLILALGGNGYKEVPFDITVSYADLGQPVLTDTLVGCRIVNDTNSNAEGTDPTKVAVQLNVMTILYNGISPLNPILFSQPTG